jgi:hypothetical protein
MGEILVESRTIMPQFRARGDCLMAGASIAAREEAYRKRREAAKMKRAGHTWDEIAATVGYHDRSGACTAVKLLMQEQQGLAYGEADLYRQESLDRLEALLHACWKMAMEGSDKHVTQARLIISQIGDLRGEKAPLEVQFGESDVDRLLREAQEEFQRRAAELDQQASGVQAPSGADS